MKLENFNTELISWNSVKKLETGGETGVNTAAEFIAGNIRIRLAEYSANYKSAEICHKGHIIHCIEGEITLHFEKGRNILLTAGNSIVINDGDSHTASTPNFPAKLFVID